MKALWKALSAAAMIGMTVFSAQAEEKSIKVGTMSWEDLTPITGITKKVLEDAGYSVDVVSFSEWGIAYAALAKGDVQILASQTDYVAHDYWDKNKNKL
jgi:glycine betaine/proline transport system substrate-binding protein